MAIAKSLKTHSRACRSILTCPLCESVVRREKRTRCNLSPTEIICVEVPVYIQPLLITRLTRSESLHALAEASNVPCLSRPKLTAFVEPVEGGFSILADLDEVAVGVTHAAAPFPAAIV